MAGRPWRCQRRSQKSALNRRPGAAQRLQRCCLATADPHGPAHSASRRSPRQEAEHVRATHSGPHGDGTAKDRGPGTTHRPSSRSHGPTAPAQSSGWRKGAARVLGGQGQLGGDAGCTSRGTTVARGGKEGPVPQRSAHRDHVLPLHALVTSPPRGHTRLPSCAPRRRKRPRAPFPRAGPGADRDPAHTQLLRCCPAWPGATVGEGGARSGARCLRLPDFAPRPTQEAALAGGPFGCRRSDGQEPGRGTALANPSRAGACPTRAGSCGGGGGGAGRGTR